MVGCNIRALSETNQRKNCEYLQYPAQRCNHPMADYWYVGRLVHTIKKSVPTATTLCQMLPVVRKMIQVVYLPTDSNNDRNMKRQKQRIISLQIHRTNHLLQCNTDVLCTQYSEDVVSYRFTVVLSY